MSPAGRGVKKPTILFCSPEAVPFSKTGGLGDVAGALPKALSRQGHDVRIVTPLYGFIDRRKHGIRPLGKKIPVSIGHRVFEAALHKGFLPDSRIPVYFIEHGGYFDRKGVYQEDGADYPDNLDRFAFFSKASLEMLPALEWCPRVVHANDWQTALAPVYLKTLLREADFYRGIKTIFTIHNLGYQGLFERESFPRTGLGWDLFTIDGLEYYGKGNLLKGGILFADMLTTVSPHYSREILTSEYGFGLEGVLAAREKDLYGVLNGMDAEEWNPEADGFIPKRYSASRLSGKNVCRAALRKECGLPEADVPLLAMISRLDEQKGFDLLLEIMDELMEADLQLVILGTGKPAYHQRLKDLATRHPKNLSVHLAFDNALAHRIEAGADIFLMPSRYEPCGLNQLYSLRYGTLPVARKTGGLVDTIVDYSPRTVRSRRANGFLFEHYAGTDFLKIILLALKVYQDKLAWKQMMTAAMKADYSWDRSAETYAALYQKAIHPGRMNG